MPQAASFSLSQEQALEAPLSNNQAAFDLASMPTEISPQLLTHVFYLLW